MQHKSKPSGRKPMRIGALLLKEVPYQNEWRIQATWRDPDRKKKWFNNWRHAEDFAAKENKRLDELKEKGAGRYTFADAAARFRKEYESLSKMKNGACGPDTFYIYCGILDRHLLPRWEHVRLDLISGPDVKQWVIEQRKEASVKTVMLRLTLFRQILGCAVADYKMLHTFPADVAKVRVPGKLSKRADIPHQSDLEKLRKYLNDPRPLKNSRYRWSCLRVMTFFGASCGMRPGEVAAIHFEDIDRATGEINISKARARLAGIKGPKTEAGKRKIPTTFKGRALIDEHADVHKQLVGKCVGPVLRTRERDFVTAHLISTWFREIMREVGLVKPGTTIPKFPFYGLRHWSASHWTKALHGDVHQVAKWMGHKNSSLTLDVYGHVIDDPEARARFERMPDWLNPLVEIEESPSSSQRPVEIMAPLALPAPNDYSFEFSPSDVNGQQPKCRIEVPDFAEPWVRPFIDLLAQGTPIAEAYDWLVRQLDNKRSTKNPRPITLHTAYERATEEFKRLKLPGPKSLATRFRAERILELHAQKYQVLDIARMINCHASRVYQVLRERGHNFNPNNPLNRRINLGSNFGRKPQPEHKTQLKLL